jgi:pantetheine-phosphate adenylyltransferase
MIKRIVYPGTFDPITNGHIDLVKRASELFDEVIVSIAANPGKKPMFTLGERVELTKMALEGVTGVRVRGFSGLLVHYLEELDVRIILRGLRAVSDFEYEFQLAAMNRRLNSQIETVFLTPAENYTFISASLIKEIASLGGNVAPFVHPNVNDAIRVKLNQQ